MTNPTPDPKPQTFQEYLRTHPPHGFRPVPVYHRDGDFLEWYWCDGYCSGNPVLVGGRHVGTVMHADVQRIVGVKIFGVRKLVEEAMADNPKPPDPTPTDPLARLREIRGKASCPGTYSAHSLLAQLCDLLEPVLSPPRKINALQVVSDRDHAAIAEAVAAERAAVVAYLRSEEHYGAADWIAAGRHLETES